MHETLSQQQMIRKGMQDGVSLPVNVKEKIAVVQEWFTIPEQGLQVYSGVRISPRYQDSCETSVPKYQVIHFMSMVEVRFDS